MLWHLCLSPVVNIFNKRLSLCRVFAHPWTRTHLRGRAGSTTSYSACQTFPIIKPCFQLLITLLNLNHLGFSFPCQVSALGWIFCYPFFFFFFSCQPKKKGSAVSEKMARENPRACNTKKILGNLSCKILDPSCCRERTGNLKYWKTLSNQKQQNCSENPFHNQAISLTFLQLRPSWTPFRLLPFWPWQDSLTTPSQPSCTRISGREPGFLSSQLSY